MSRFIPNPFGETVAKAISFLIFLGILVIVCKALVSVYFEWTEGPVPPLSASEQKILQRFKEECAHKDEARDVVTLLSRCLAISTKEDLVSALNYLGGDTFRVTIPGSGYITRIERLSDFTVIFPNDPRWNEALVAFLTQERVKP